MTRSLQQGAPIKSISQGPFVGKRFMISCGRLSKYKHGKVVRLPAVTVPETVLTGL